MKSTREISPGIGETLINNVSSGYGRVDVLSKESDVLEGSKVYRIPCGYDSSKHYYDDPDGSAVVYADPIYNDPVAYDCDEDATEKFLELTRKAVKEMHEGNDDVIQIMNMAEIGYIPLELDPEGMRSLEIEDKYDVRLFDN